MLAWRKGLGSASGALVLDLRIFLVGFWVFLGRIDRIRLLHFVAELCWSSEGNWVALF
jgi:hypothetical protein